MHVIEPLTPAKPRPVKPRPVRMPFMVNSSPPQTTSPTCHAVAPKGEGGFPHFVVRLFIPALSPYPATHEASHLLVSRFDPGVPRPAREFSCETALLGYMKWTMTAHIDNTLPGTDSTIDEAAFGLYLDESAIEDGTDIHAIVEAGAVSVTPLSLDLTSRVDMDVVRDLRHG